MAIRIAPPLDEVLTAVVDATKTWRVPGVSVAAVRAGKVVHAGGLGLRSVDGPAAVTSRTLFHHGSCCKAYTSLLATLVAHDGLLDLDEPVTRWVPELRLPDGRAADVTTRDLLSHRSGISRHDLTWILNSSWGRSDLVGRLEHLPLASGLRERMEYSNLGYTLAGLVLERVTGSSWDEQLQARVLRPLGMGRTTTSVERMRADDDAAVAHLDRDGRAVPTPDRDLVGAAPAGALITSADDAARWLLLQTGTLDDVPAAAVRATHEPGIAMPAGAAPLPGMELDAYALGWLVGTYRGSQLRWHSGGIDGFATQTFVLPEREVGVTVSANLHGSLLAMAAALELLDAVLDEVGELSWFDQLAQLAESANPESTDRPADAAAPASADVLRGTYRHAGYGDLVVTPAGNGLGLRLGESELGLRHVDGDSWELRYDVLDAAYPLTFERDDDGSVIAATSPLDPPSAPTRFVRIAS